MDQSSSRSRSSKTTTSSYKIKTKEIKEKIKSKKEVSGYEIEKFLNECPHFIGCYADDQCKSISIQSFPAFIIFNLDNSAQPGSHWLALRIDRTSVEVFDPLGFDISLWPRTPIFLFDYLRRLSLHRKLLFNRQIQNSNSVLCGFYCIFYIIMRQTCSLSKIESKFSKRVYKNDSILLYLFQCLTK